MWSDKSTVQIHLVNTGLVLTRSKSKRTSPIATNTKFKNQHLSWYEGVLASKQWVTCTSVKEPLMQGTYTFWSIFFQGWPRLFQQDNAQPHSTCATTASLPGVQTCLPVKMCGALWCAIYDKGYPGLLRTRSVISSKTGKKFHFPNYHNCFYHFPKDYWTPFKGKVM